MTSGEGPRDPASQEVDQFPVAQPLHFPIIDQCIPPQAYHPLLLIFLAERETHTRRTELCAATIIVAWEPDAHVL
jgi:hypothetical protein